MELVSQATLNDRMKHVYMTTTDITHKLYIDQIGRFPITLNQGNSIVVIFHCTHNSYIKLYPIKSHHRSNLLNAYTNMYVYPQIRGYEPQLHKMDNNTSCDVEDFIAKHSAKQ